MHKPKIVAIICVLLVSLVFVAGCAEDGAVIARVNGEKILQSQLDDRVAMMQTELSAQGYTFGEEEQDQEIMTQMEETAKSQLITEALIMQQAKEKGIAVEEAAVQEQITQMKQQFGADTFNEYLKQLGITEAKLAGLLKVQLTQEALFDEVTAEVIVDGETAKAEFDKAPEQYEQIKVSHILISADSSQEDQVQAAETEAKEVIAKLDAGEDFAALAQESSDDTQTGAADGVLDMYFTRGDTSLVPEFVEGSFALDAVGQYSKEPVRTDYGFHIIKVMEKQDTFEELKETLQEQLAMEAKNQAFNDFIEEAMAEAEIENFD